MSQTVFTYFKEKISSYFLPIEIIYLFLAVTAAVSPLREKEIITSLFFRNVIVIALIAIVVQATQSFFEFHQKLNIKKHKNSTIYFYLALNLIFNLLVFLIIGGLFNIFIFSESITHFIIALIGFAAINIFVMIINIISQAIFPIQSLRFGFFGLVIIPVTMLPLLFGALTQSENLSFAAFIPPHLNILLLQKEPAFKILIHTILSLSLLIFAMYITKKKSILHRNKAL